MSSTEATISRTFHQHLSTLPSHEANSVDFQMKRLEARIESLKKQYSHKAFTYWEGVSSTGQLYIILELERRLFTTVFTVFLLVEDPFPHLDPTLESVLRRVAHRKDHNTRASAKAFREKIQLMFTKPTMSRILEIFPSFPQKYDRKFAVRKLKPGWHLKIDENFERGDILLCVWKNLWFGKLYHAGIYIGNGQVVHRTGGGQSELNSKFNSYPKQGRLVGEFTEANSDIWVMKFVVRIRSGEEIAEEAEKIALYAANNPGVMGKYKLGTNDCQKFVMFCALGESYEWEGPLYPHSRF